VPSLRPAITKNSRRKNGTATSNQIIMDRESSRKDSKACVVDVARWATSHTNAGKMIKIRTKGLITGNQKRVTIRVTTVTKQKIKNSKGMILQVIAIYAKRKAIVRKIAIRKERKTQL
jgi:hypothetical protein